MSACTVSSVDQLGRGGMQRLTGYSTSDLRGFMPTGLKVNIGQNGPKACLAGMGTTDRREPVYMVRDGFFSGNVDPHPVAEDANSPAQIWHGGVAKGGLARDDVCARRIEYAMKMSSWTDIGDLRWARSGAVASSEAAKLVTIHKTPQASVCFGGAPEDTPAFRRDRRKRSGRVGRRGPTAAARSGRAGGHR